MMISNYKVEKNIFKRTISAFKDENREDKRYTLIRFRFANTLILFVIFLLFISSNLLKESYEIFHLIKAFSEAAMVGALADWFAVVALFKYPMGIPIPHTAIIPKNKNKIGESLKDFIKDEFLNEEVLNQKLDSTNPSKQIASWLSLKKNRETVTGIVRKILPEIFKIFQSEEFTKFILLNLKEGLRKVKLSDILANIVEAMIDNNNHHLMIKTVVKEIRIIIQKNQGLIKEKIEQETPWWTFGLLDDKIYKKTITAITDFLDEFENDPDHKFRKEIDIKIEKLLEDLKQDKNLKNKVEDYKTKLIESEQITDTIVSMVNKLSNKLNSDILNDKSALIDLINSTLLNFSKNLENNAEMQEKLNTFFKDTAIKAISENADKICSIISEKIKEWKEEEITEKLEIQIGKDLQYIRVNGAIAGGIIGIVIYLISNIL